ncbi:MAG: hypothetical protein ABI602_00990 [Candidatus Saccharibacteria bacterium]
MDNQEVLKARSVELAERANRLAERAGGTESQTKLRNCADELINLDNAARFEAAQSALEHSTQWSEDQRSLAHEINAAWLAQWGHQPMSFEQVLEILDGWVHTYQASSHPEIRTAGQNLRQALDQLVIPAQPAVQKDALNYLLELFEVLLSHLEAKQEQVNDQMKHTIHMLRNLRDATLVTRELTVDEADLLDNEKSSATQFDKVTAARDALDEIYASITPIIVPH